MRTLFNKKYFTKPERMLGRMLQELKIPFRTKVQISNHECDFVIGKYCVEVNGHEQRTHNNEIFASLGFIPLHFDNNEIYSNRENIKNKLKQLNVN